MSDIVRSVLTGTSALALALAVSAALTFVRRGWHPDSWLFRVAWLALAVQAAHFGEEWATGFRMRFPELMGLSVWPDAFFVTFNVVWIVVWMASLWALARGVRVAVLPLWFLALGTVANGIAHPLFALAAGGYFPGLYTSPVVGIAGCVLLRKLGAATAPAESPRRSGR